MGDADLATELTQLIINGIQDRRPTLLDKIYRDNDKKFPSKDDTKRKLNSIMSFIKDNLEPVAESKLCNSAIFYSLFGALALNKFGLPNDDHINLLPSDKYFVTNNFSVDIEKATNNIMELLNAYERREEYEQENVVGLNYDYKEFVIACTSTTHRIKQRSIRIKWLYLALNDQL